MYWLDIPTAKEIKPIVDLLNFILLYIRASAAFSRARSVSQRQLGNAGWVAPVIYQFLDGSICMTLVAWKVPDG